MIHSPMPIITMDQVMRFYNKIENYSDSQSCWFWIGGKDKDGYGKFGINYKHYRANRVAYWIYNHIDPGDLDVLHTCNTPSCVSPKCLILGTPVENTQYIIACGRRQNQYGTNNPQNILTEEQVIEIRKLCGKLSQKQIATKYNISQSAVSLIYLRKNWSCL